MKSLSMPLSHVPRKPRLAYLYQKKFAGSYKTINSKYLVEKVIFLEDVILGVSGTEVSLSYKGRPLGDFADVFVPYFVVDSAYSDFYSISLFRALEITGLPVLNTLKLYQLCGDKFAAHSVAAAYGLCSPKTLMLIPEELDIEKALLLVEKTIPYPLFIKPRGLLKSIGAVKVTDRAQLLAVLQLYAKAELLPVVQEYVDAEKAEYRLYYLGEECLFAYLRTNQLGLFKDRVYVRTDVDAVPEKIRRKCGALLASLKPDFVALDFFASNGVFLLNEIEAFPGITYITGSDRALLQRKIAVLVAKKKEALKRGSAKR